MNKIELENAIIELDSVLLLARLITETESTLSAEDLQTACILMREVTEEKVDKVRKAFYGGR